MFDSLLVPVDGSTESARSLGPAGALAHYLDVPLQVVAFHAPADDGFELTELVRHQLSAIGDVGRKLEVAPMTEPVADLVAERLARFANPLVVMTTRGHGRSAAVLGSVANDILATGMAPLLLVGPNSEPGHFRLHGPLIVPVDGDNPNPATIDIVRRVAEAFDYVPQVVQVIDPDVAAQVSSMRRGPAGSDLPPETAMVHNVARRLGHDVDYTVLHSDAPGAAIAERAAEVGASLVAMATHARTGLERLRLGSVTAQVVTHARCPVLAIPPSTAADT